MAFDTGALSFRMFDGLNDWPEEYASLFEADAAPPIERMGTEPIQGWVGGRHMLDVPLTEENIHLGGYPRLILMRAERKIPPALFRAYCMLEEQIVRKAEGRPFLHRRQRAEIRTRVLEEWLPKMPPHLQGIPFVADPSAGMLYAAALSDSQLDAFTLAFRRTTNLDAMPVSIATIAARRGVDVRRWMPVSFSPTVDADHVDESPGQDFLTWIWYRTETGAEIITDPDLGRVGCGIEGPLVFSIAEGGGAQEAVLRRGSPVQSAEARTCLLGGKKLRRAKLMLAVGDDAFTLSFDADTFVCRSVKVPEEDPPAMDPVTRFQDRMIKLGRFRDALLLLANRFIEEREDSSRWSATVDRMRRWADERGATG